jgi:DNA-binding CsgD family transcriptional regulator
MACSRSIQCSMLPQDRSGGFLLDSHGSHIHLAGRVARVPRAPPILKQSSPAFVALWRGARQRLARCDDAYFDGCGLMAPSSRSRTSPDQLDGEPRHQHLSGVEMFKSKSVHMFANVVADAAALEAWDDGSVRDEEGLESSSQATTRESACPPSCRVCFLARKYRLNPREVTVIALISAGKSGRAISQTLGIAMPTIRKYCGIIHAKSGTHSRLAIALRAIREGMVKSGVQPKSGFL